MPPNPPNNAHGDMQISKYDKKKFLAPPSQILGTPLMPLLTMPVDNIQCFLYN